MFDAIKKCLEEYDKACCDHFSNPTEENEHIIEFFDLHLAEAIISDLRYYDKGAKLAKIILAELGIER